MAIEAADDVGLGVHQLADLQNLFAISVDALKCQTDVIRPGYGYIVFDQFNAGLDAIDERREAVDDIIARKISM